MSVFDRAPVGQMKPLASAVALAVSASILAPLSQAEDAVSLGKVVVEGTGVVNPYAEEGAPLKAKKTSDSRRTRDIADTPATIQVFTKEYIADSGKTELKDLLAAQPGITLGTGEGGNSFGDRYIIRGYEARNDVFNDGIREPGLLTRETFAIEQIELTKGPSGTFAGRGSTGGAVNSVTKKANQDEEFTIVELGVGTDGYRRGTADINQWIGDDSAIRVNLLKHEAEIPDQGPGGEDRKGAAIAFAHQVNDDLKFDLDYYHFRANDKPVISGTNEGDVIFEYPYSYDGTWTHADTGKTIDYSSNNTDRDGNSLGSFNEMRAADFEKTDIDTVTLTVDYNLNDTTRIENKLRHGESDHQVVVSFAKGNGVQTKQARQTNDYLGNQTNVIMERGDHTLVAGVELSDEQYELFRNPLEATVNNTIDIKTQAVYLMDTFKVNEQTEVFAGARYDRFDYQISDADGIVGEQDRGAWNYHLGGTYALTPQTKVYAAAGTSTNFSGEIVDAGTSSGYGGYAGDIEPEKTTNLELGVKSNLMDEKLLATAALFQITKDNVAETWGGDDYDSSTLLTTGENRVQGLEFDLAGNLTDKWSVHAGVSLSTSKILDSIKNGSNSYQKTCDWEEQQGGPNAGSWAYGRGCDRLGLADGVQGVDSSAVATVTPDSIIGKPKSNFADNSASVMLTYAATNALKVGGTWTVSDGMTRGQPDEAGDSETLTAGYGFLDLHGSYEIAPNMTLTANVNNVFDKDYVTAIYRGAGIIYMGDGRSAKVSLKYKF